MGRFLIRLALSQPQARFQRVLLCGLLCLTAWRGPIPWGHAHESQSNGSVVEAAAYDHWLKFHQDHDLSAAESTDWHWHWLLPSDLFPEDPGRSVPECQLRPALLVSQTDWVETLNVSTVTCLTLVRHASAIDIPLGPPHSALDDADFDDRPVSFLNTFADVIDARSLIGVALC